MAQNRKQSGKGERRNKGETRKSRNNVRAVPTRKGQRVQAFRYADRVPIMADALRHEPNQSATAARLFEVLHKKNQELFKELRRIPATLRQAPDECAAAGIERDGRVIKLRHASRNGKDTRPPSARPTPGDPLQFFKPKSSADYLALMQARVLTKSRSHEKLIERYGLWVASRGFRPSTSDHPRDIVIRRRREEWLTEAKVVYRGNATQAVRAAIGQLLTYQHMLPGKPTGLLALFSENIGVAYSQLLESLGVASVWWDAGRWRGSPQAINSDLAE